MEVEYISSYDANSRPHGKSYGSWTVEWWRWVLAIPKFKNPIMDATGENTSIHQNNEHVSFLAGKMASENTILPTRSCTVSSRKSILFPVINCETNQLEQPELKSHQEIIDRVKKDEDSIIKRECYVDGKPIIAERIKSDPVIFTLRLAEENVFNVKGGNTYASADGYWVFLRPLPKGDHIVSFHGSCEYGKLNSGAVYHLWVT